MNRPELELNPKFIKYEQEENIEAISAFMKAIRHQVFLSRELIEGTGGYNIRRGMAHVIAGYCEDLFALYVAKYVGKTEIKYFVDKVIKAKFEGAEKMKTFKPDLAIVNSNNVLTHYFDLKTNLGWNRKMKDFLIDKNTLIEDLIKNKVAIISSKKSWLNDYDEHGNINLLNYKYPCEKELKVKVSEDLKYHVVIVFGGNINEEDMKSNLDFLNKFKLKHIKIDILKPKDNEPYDMEAFNNIHSTLKVLKK